MNINYLADHREAIPTLVQWYQAEWEPYYGNDGPGDAQADLAGRCNRETQPVGFVALENGTVVGTASIGLDITTGWTPSIIGVLVEANHREKGTGTALIAACRDAARELGYQHLQISTSVLGNMLERTGWRKMGSATFLNDEQGTVYIVDL